MCDTEKLCFHITQLQAVSIELKWQSTYSCHWEEHDLEIFAISKSKLLTRNNYLTVFTVTKKVWPIWGSKHNNRVLNLVTQCLLVVIMEVDVALFNIGQVHWIPVKLPGSFEQEFIFLVDKAVILPVHFGLVVEAEILLVWLWSRPLSLWLRLWLRFWLCRCWFFATTDASHWF